MAAPTDSVEIPAIPTSVVTAAGGDIHPVSQGGITKQETNAQILTWIESAIALNANKITAGQLALARGGTGADLSATGGANQIVRQNSAGGVFTVSALAAGDIPNLDAGKVTTGVMAVARGGTGLGAYTVGDLLIADGAASLAALAGVATGNALISGGVGAAPAWGKIGLTTHVSGILPSANGGTGVNNAGTITNATNTTITGGGTLALGGFTLTVPATGSAALLATANVFSAVQSVAIDDAITNTVTTLLTLDHSSSGTPAIAFGTRILFNLESTTTLARNAAAIDAVWSVATDATRQSNVVINTVTGGGALAEVARFTPNGMTIMNNQSAFFATNQLALISAAGAAQMGNQSATAGSSLRLNGGTGTGATNFVSVFLAGVEQVRWSSAANAASSAAVVDNMILRRNPVSGTPAAGTGHQIRMVGKTDTTADRDQLAISSEWVVATEASQTTRVKLNVFDTAAREAIRLEASGSAPMIGFLGANAAIRQTGGAATATGTWTATEQAMLQAIYDAGRTFGFLT